MLFLWDCLISLSAFYGASLYFVGKGMLMTLVKSTSQLALEYEHLSRLFATQPGQTQNDLSQQAWSIAAALEQNGRPIRFRLPNRVVLEGGASLSLASAERKLSVNGGANRSERLVRYLSDLERSPNPGLAVCGKLMRYALGWHIVYHLIPDGRKVQYLTENGDDIPSIPAGGATETEPFNPGDDGLHAPYVPAARRFYLPQWVAFGDDDCLLAASLKEAEATIASLEKTVRLMQEAAAICPSLVSDETYQRKRAGLLGQLINQGRALARAYTREIIERIHVRAAAGTLNRGLSLSLPYFDDDALTLRTYPVNIIPDGRIMFIAAFVVRAMRIAKAQVVSDTHLNSSTRRHLLAQLTSIESAFYLRSN